MKFIYKIFGLLLFSAVMLTSCKKDVTEFNPSEITPPDFSKMVNSDFAGTVVDEAGLPLQNVEITIGSELTETDENGVFIIKNARVSARKAFVKASKSGYFHGSRTMFAENGKLHFAKIQLLEKENVGNFETASGGTINFQDAELVFPANGIKLKDGGNYAGQVNVFAKYLSPDDDRRDSKMPGDLRGINTKGEEIVMATFGMTAVELIGAGGEELQVADGMEVGISTPLPASFASLAPSTIPLWFFDENDGLWKEEGVAELQGDRYVGSVAHFTWWNNDFPYDAVDVKGKIVDEDGNPLAGVHVNIRVVGDSYGGHGRTNADGVFCGGMPKGRELELTIVGEGDCFNWNQPIFSQVIGTFTENTTLPTITVTVSSGTAKKAKISGRLVDCDGNPVTEGYVQGKYGREDFQLYIDNPNGTFEVSLIYCDDPNDFEIKGYDLKNALQSEQLFFLQNDNVVVGDLKTCDQFEEFIKYNLDGNDFTIPGKSIYGGPRWTSFSSFLTNTTNIEMAVETGEEIGTFPLVDGGVGGQSPDLDSLNWTVNNVIMDDNVTVEVTFTRYDASGTTDGLIIGTFNGDFDDKSGMNHKLSGTFRSRRD